jgi:hypothetical protein
MPRIAYLILALCFIGASAALAWWSRQVDAEPLPDLSAEPAVKDFGEIPQGIYDAEFKLVNNASAPIKIKEIIKNCDCADISMSSGEVLPTESVLLNCKWNTRGRRGPTATDLAVLYIKEGAAQSAFLRLRLQAKVTPDFWYSPEELKFTKNAPATLSVRFRPGQVSQLSLLKAYTNHRAFQATLRAEAPEVAVAFNPELWSGDRKAMELVVETSSRNEPTCRIPLLVEVEAE